MIGDDAMPICPECGLPMKDVMQVDGRRICITCGMKEWGLMDKSEETPVEATEKVEEVSEDVETEEVARIGGSVETSDDSEETDVEESDEECAEDGPQDEEKVSEDSEDVESVEEPTSPISVESEETQPEPEPKLEPKLEPEPVEKESPVGGFFAKFNKRTERKQPKKSNENPDPDSFSERRRRAKLIRQENHVILKTLTRDPKTGWMHLDVSLIPFSELPEEAVECTGERHTFCLDKVRTSAWYIENRPVIED